MCNAFTIIKRLKFIDWIVGSLNEDKNIVFHSVNLIVMDNDNAKQIVLIEMSVK